MIRRPPRSTLSSSSAASDVYKRQVLHLPPCPLCLEQRQPYYFCVPLAALLFIGANYGASSKMMIAGFAVITAFMLWNSGLGVYHAGVAWKWWQGPIGCSGPINKFGAASGI